MQRGWTRLHGRCEGRLRSVPHLHLGGTREALGIDVFVKKRFVGYCVLAGKAMCLIGLSMLKFVSLVLGMVSVDEGCVGLWHSKAKN
jgi:hypothetical protein